LSPTTVGRIAAQSGFVKRRPRKADAFDILKAYCLLSATQQRISLASTAALIALLNDTQISKQAIKKRTTPATVRFFKNVLAEVIKSPSDATALKSEFQHFSRVLIQDSTTVALPPALADRYPGSRNQTGKTFAQMKIQTVFDLKNNSYVDFSPTPFTRNDQAAAGDIHSLCRQGDLVLRDLGYFVTNSLQQFVDKKVSFISRLRTDVAVYDADGKVLSLHAILKAKGRLDRTVYIGSKEKVPVRMIALPVPAEIANKRRRDLRHNRDRRCNPTKQHLALCNWIILVTNISDKICSAQQIANLYFLRWRIETLFKTWKSYCNFKSLPAHASADQVESIIYARLIFVTVFNSSIAGSFAPAEKISIQKLTCFVTSFFWILICKPSLSNNKYTKLLRYYCSYEKRKRKSIFEKYLLCQDKQLKISK
jgi:hypothetical protein